MQILAHDDPRIETGVLQFGEDWPGVFIRGDNAFAYAMALDGLLNGRNDGLTRAQVGGLLTLLRSSDTRALAAQHEGEGERNADPS